MKKIGLDGHILHMTLWNNDEAQRRFQECLTMETLEGWIRRVNEPSATSCARVPFVYEHWLGTELGATKNMAKPSLLLGRMLRLWMTGSLLKGVAFLRSDCSPGILSSLLNGSLHGVSISFFARNAIRAPQPDSVLFWDVVPEDLRHVALVAEPKLSTCKITHRQEILNIHAV